MSVLCEELTSELRDYYIENIYQISFSTLIFKLNKPASPSRELVIEAGRRIHFTRYIIEKPFKPPQFCKALRKYLINSRIRLIEQPDFERIVIIRTSSKNNYNLIVELFGKGNIILTDSENKIVHALTYRKMRDRWIIRGEELKLPPSKGLDPQKIALEEFSRRIKESSGRIVKVLANILSVSNVYTAEFLKLAKIDENLDCRMLTDKMIEGIWKAVLLNLRKKENPQPCIVYDKQNLPVDIIPFPLTVYEGYRFEYYPTLNDAFDEYFSKKMFEEKKRTGEEQIEMQVEEQKRILKEQTAKLKELEEISAKKKIIGDLIHKHAAELQTIIQFIRDLKDKGKEWSEIEKEIEFKQKLNEFPFIFYRSLEPKEKKVNLNVEGVEFSLSIEKSPYLNASAYFDESKREREKIAHLKDAINQTLDKIRVIEKNATVETKVEKPVKIVEKKWFEKYRFFYSSDGFLVVSGKDASSNEALVKRYTEANDVVFHADIIGAPFTVIKKEGKEPSDQTLYEAAQFTACYSRAWRDGLASADVYYVKPEQISKKAPSGQFLSRGAFIIRGRRNYVRKIPLRLAIGVKMNGEAAVFAGPPPAVSEQTPYHVEITVGSEDSKNIAAKIKFTIIGLVPKEHKEKILRLTLEKIASLIPYGRASIVKTGGI